MSQVFAFSVYINARACTPSVLGNAGRLLHDTAILGGILLRIECLDGLGLLHLILTEDELDAVAKQALGLTESQAEATTA